MIAESCPTYHLTVVGLTASIWHLLVSDVRTILDMQASLTPGVDLVKVPNFLHGLTEFGPSKL